MATLTAWCEKNNHAVESDPNFRISDDLYLLLAKEFNKDMAVKIEADRLAAERQAREEAEAAARADQLLTIDEATKLLSVSKMTLHRWDHNGILKKVEIGGKRRYRKSDIERLAGCKL